VCEVTGTSPDIELGFPKPGFIAENHAKKTEIIPREDSLDYFGGLRFFHFRLSGATSYQQKATTAHRAYKRQSFFNPLAINPGRSGTDGKTPPDQLFSPENGPICLGS
jgi:hypothetical protein